LVLTTYLHSSTYILDGIYQVWHQIYDGPETLEKDDGSDYYESYAVSTRMNVASYNKMSSLNMWGQGFRGEYEFKDALGSWNAIDLGSQTATTPWFLSYNLSAVEILVARKPWMGGRIKNVITRDFVTSWSDFNLKGGDTLKVHFGYRVYASYDSGAPVAKGFV